MLPPKWSNTGSVQLHVGQSVLRSGGMWQADPYSTPLTWFRPVGHRGGPGGWFHSRATYVAAPIAGLIGIGYVAFVSIIQSRWSFEQKWNIYKQLENWEMWVNEVPRDLSLRWVSVGYLILHSTPAYITFKHFLQKTVKCIPICFDPKSKWWYVAKTSFGSPSSMECSLRNKISRRAL